MSLLEKCLQRSAPPLPGLVSGLFCGQLAYVTRCLTCNNASKRTTPFNELELQIGVRCLAFPGGGGGRTSKKEKKGGRTSFLLVEILKSCNKFGMTAHGLGVPKYVGAYCMSCFAETIVWFVFDSMYHVRAVGMKSTVECGQYWCPNARLLFEHFVLVHGFAVIRLFLYVV